MSKWLNYNISQQTYFPKTVNDVVNCNYDNIHNQMYERAKEKAIQQEIISQGIDPNKIRIIEICKSNDYIFPSELLIIYRNGKSLVRHTIPLDDYWDNDFEVKNKYYDNSTFITKLDNDWYPYNDIINYDYINGKATLENRMETKKHKVSFKDLSTDDEIKIDYQT